MPTQGQRLTGPHVHTSNLAWQVQKLVNALGVAAWRFTAAHSAGAGGIHTTLHFFMLHLEDACGPLEMCNVQLSPDYHACIIRPSVRCMPTTLLKN